MAEGRPSEHEQFARRVLELSTAYEVSKLLGSSLELEQNLTGILRILNSFMGMRKGTILLYDSFREELAIRVAAGMTSEEIVKGKYRKGEGILGKVMLRGVPTVIPDIGAEPQYFDPTQSRGDMRERDALLEQARTLQQELRSRYRPESIIGQSKKMGEEIHHEELEVHIRCGPGCGLFDLALTGRDHGRCRRRFREERRHESARAGRSHRPRTPET